MKIKDIERKFNPYCDPSGKYTIQFKKEETVQVLKKLASKLECLKKKYPSLNVDWDLDLYQNHAYLHWDRDCTKEEQKKINELKKKEKEEWKKTHIRDIKREAKKLGII